MPTCSTAKSWCRRSSRRCDAYPELVRGRELLESVMNAEEQLFRSHRQNAGRLEISREKGAHQRAHGEVGLPAG